MSFAYLKIIPEKGATIKAQFNPEKYTVSKSVQFAEIAIPGLDAPVVQYVRGQNERLTMELFFDTTESGMVDNVKDVREETRKVYQLLKVNSETHAPPRVKIEWGQGNKLTSHGTNIAPRLVLESANEEFTLFSPQGVPLRARMQVVFREAWTIEEQLQETPRHSSDRTRLLRVQRGQTLSHIAGTEYDDPHLWRAIAEENDLDNPRYLEPGMILTIPRVTPEGV